MTTIPSSETKECNVNKTLAMLITAAALAAPTAWADHNSPFGVGWATDAMGKHAEAMETVDSDMMANAPVDRTDMWGIDIDRVIDTRESAGERRADIDELRSETMSQARESMAALRDSGSGRAAR
jgi:hypothetical protein